MATNIWNYPRLYGFDDRAQVVGEFLRRAGDFTDLTHKVVKDYFHIILTARMQVSAYTIPPDRRGIEDLCGQFQSEQVISQST